MYNALSLSIVIHVRHPYIILSTLSRKSIRLGILCDEGDGRSGESGRFGQDTAWETREYNVLFAGVINSTHTGCLSHFKIEGAELSTPERTKIRARNGEKTALLLERRKSLRKSNAEFYERVL